MVATYEKKVLKKYVWNLLSEEEQRLANLAGWDLYFGPLGETDDDGKPWCGFQSAIEQVSSALDSLGDLWVEGDYVSDREPEGFTDEETGEYVEPYWEEIYFFSRKDALREAFGELASYL